MIRIFRHYLPKGLVILGLAEMLVFWAAIRLGASVRAGSHHALTDLAAPLHSKVALFVVVMLLVMTSFGLYQRDLKEGRWGYFPRLVISLAFGFLMFYLLLPFDPHVIFPPATVAYALLVALVGTAATRLAYIALVSHESRRRHVLVLGTGRRARAVLSLASGSLARPGFHIVGFVPLGEKEPTGEALPLLPAQSLLDVARFHHVSEIVVANRDRRHNLPMHDLLACKLTGVQVLDVTTFFEKESGRIELESLNTSWLVFADGFRQGVSRTLIKRAFDVCVSAILLIVALPVMVVVAFAIWAEDRGPILYRQERVGQGGKIFPLYKFRSMRVHAERDGTPRWASAHDARVTRVGRIIRNMRIDELPQAINVLRGDMSFVGPRPERPFFVDELIERIPFYNHRHTIKPGITGWAQVLYPYGASVEDAREKLKYDLYYVKNNSLFLDLIILFQTAQVVIFQKGSR
ncbi:MAG: TIGR03013 family PEP-CTERM/XrtA system glycosyltransferase [Gammaproteobacteria bacterium]|nr:TIGR03013 family PEP-CTERM/XrtA system glycosyltransferase [Gammaproteobacteria bacterium]